MFTYEWWGLCGTLFLFFMTTTGAAAVFFFRGQVSPRVQSITLGFAGGVMAAASVWSLLLPSIAQSAALALPDWCPAAAGIAAGGLFLDGLDRVLLRFKSSHSQSTLLFCAITLHNIPEGMAVGLAFAMAEGESGLLAAAALALGIGIQNVPEGSAISLPLYQGGLSRRQAFFRGMLSGTVEPLSGMAVFSFAAAAVTLMPWLLGFAAGAMLYVTVSELIPQSASPWGTAAFTAGFMLMMILDVALG